MGKRPPTILVCYESHGNHQELQLAVEPQVSRCVSGIGSFRSNFSGTWASSVLMKFKCPSSHAMLFLHCLWMYWAHKKFELRLSKTITFIMWTLKINLLTSLPKVWSVECFKNLRQDLNWC